MLLSKAWQIILVALALSMGTVAYGQPSDSLQTSLATNLNYADSFVYLVNAGTSGGNVCANVYALDSNQEMISCQAFLVTPNALKSLSVTNDFHTTAAPHPITIKILVSAPGVGNTCNAATNPTLATLQPGLRSWMVTFSTPSPTGGTENVFQTSTPAASDVNTLVNECAFIEA